VDRIRRNALLHQFSEIIHLRHLALIAPDQPQRLTVQFNGPDGSPYTPEPRAEDGRMVGATLALPRSPEGTWTVVARLDGDEIDRRRLRVGP